MSIAVYNDLKIHLEQLESKLASFRDDPMLTPHEVVIYMERIKRDENALMTAAKLLLTKDEYYDLNIAIWGYGIR